MANIGMVRLRVAGCGQTFDFEFESSSSVGAVLDKASAAMGLTRDHIKCLYRGKQIGNGNEIMSLESAGVRDRTKLILMYTKKYHDEAKVIAQLQEFSSQVDGLDSSNKGYQEYLTQRVPAPSNFRPRGNSTLRAGSFASSTA